MCIYLYNIVVLFARCSFLSSLCLFQFIKEWCLVMTSFIIDEKEITNKETETIMLDDLFVDFASDITGLSKRIIVKM